MKLKLSYNFFVFLFFYLSVLCYLSSVFCLKSAGAEEHWEPAAIHIATTLSDGNLTVEDVVKAARAKNIKVVIITDRDFMKWEYGLWPFRNLIKKTVEMNSVFKYGVDNYLKLIKLESNKNPDMVILPGLEVAAYYHWSGSPLYRNLKISDWHKHILVFGLTGPQDYKNLPVLSNATLPKKFVAKHLLLFWPVLALFLGVIFLRKKEFSYTDDSGHVFGSYSFKWRAAGWSMLILGLLFLLNNLASPLFVFHQYADFGARPYQMLIDYCNKKGALAFWAHPEAKNISRQGDIKIETWAHVDDLWKTKDYTGYSVFYEGYEEVGKPGGEWDYLLSAYCDGKRSSPSWAIAGLAFDHGTVADFNKALDDLQIYLLLDVLNPISVLDALRRGRVYVSRGAEKNKFFLEQFSVEDTVTGKTAKVGEKIEVAGSPAIHINGDFKSLDVSPSQVQVKLVRNGKVIKVFESNAPLDVTYEDDGAPGGMSFYRIEIRNGSQLVVTNPIFVEKNKI
ncbi:MAG: hypothetical protein HZB36_04300 [Candidatus Omnitrophica bacterium]|nr:hypothetical protein [Candidatus Omnitrophota bacterium]